MTFRRNRCRLTGKVMYWFTPIRYILRTICSDCGHEITKTRVRRVLSARRAYEKYLTSKYPDKKLAILSCMDTRLTELLPAALLTLGLKKTSVKTLLSIVTESAHFFRKKARLWKS